VNGASFVSAVVREVLGDRPGARELACVTRAGVAYRALAYTDVVGAFGPGDPVILNTAAVGAGLGTGGWAFVVAPGDAPDSDGDGAAFDGGFLVKARYTPLQVLVRGVDEQDSPWHAALASADDLAAMPVVVADLHSSLPAIVAGALADRPELKIAHVASDGGALPLALSRTVAALKDASRPGGAALAATITAGQAYGGDYEAATVHSALLAARTVVAADLAVVVQGPGNLGTGTRWGFTGVAAGEAVNAAAVLGGRPVGALRMSAADPRPRHRGVSHHSLTAYGRVALRPADLVLPRLDGDLAPLGAAARAALAPLIAPAGIHRLVEVDIAGLAEALAASPVRLATMGRSYADDPVAFLAAAAAGRHAASLVP
jgi:hypothetical protein